MGLAGFGRFGTDGADLDDRSGFAASNHVLGHRLGQKDRTADQDIEHSVPDVRIDFFQQLTPGVPGDVGQRVDAAVGRDGVGHQGLAGRDIGHIQRSSLNRVLQAGLFDPGGQVVSVDIRRNNPVAVRRQAFHAGAADAVGGAGHDGHRLHQCVISPPSTYSVAPVT